MIEWIMDKMGTILFSEVVKKFVWPKAKTLWKWLKLNWVFLALIPLFVVLIVASRRSATKIIVTLFLVWLFVKVIIPILKKSKSLRYARVGRSYQSPNFDLEKFNLNI